MIGYLTKKIVLKKSTGIHYLKNDCCLFLLMKTVMLSKLRHFNFTSLVNFHFNVR